MKKIIRGWEQYYDALTDENSKLYTATINDQFEKKFKKKVLSHKEEFIRKIMTAIKEAHPN